MLPQNTRRFSTHSLQRNARYAVGGSGGGGNGSGSANNYFDLQSHLLSIPTGPAGAAVAAAAGGIASTSTSASPLCHSSLWTSIHTSNGGYNCSTLSNKNLNKAAINHFAQIQQQQQQQSSTGGGSSIAHSPSASFSSQGSRNTGGSSLQLGATAASAGGGPLNSTPVGGPNMHGVTVTQASGGKQQLSQQQLPSLSQSRTSLLGLGGIGMVRNGSSKSISNYVSTQPSTTAPMINIPAYMTISQLRPQLQ